MDMFKLKEDPIQAYLIYVNDFITMNGFISHYGFTNEEGHEVVAKGKKLLADIDETLQAHYGVYQKQVRSALFTMAGGDLKKFHEYLVILTTKLRLDSE